MKAGKSRHARHLLQFQVAVQMLLNKYERPNDALANSQLGMTYFAMGKFELAEKHLKEARTLDPGHFSHPQFVLAKIYMRRSDREAAAAQLASK